MTSKRSIRKARRERERERIELTQASETALCDCGSRVAGLLHGRRRCGECGRFLTMRSVAL